MRWVKYGAGTAPYWREPSKGDGKLRSVYTHEIDYTDEETQFFVAMERYMRINRRPFPTCRECLAVLVSLGYRRVEEPAAPPVFGRQGQP